ncbi:Cell division protein FtsI/penicillin-binding protein 2 [Candidatus Hepatincolaceae symbiont of Richtersius coronifer]
MNSKLFNRRVFILLAGKFFLFGILLFRLFYLQIKENFYFEKLSEKNRTTLVPILPKRGIIYDNLQQKIADNLFLWEALFIKSQINQSIELFVNTAGTIIDLTEDDKKRIITAYRSNPSHTPILIKQNLSQSEIAALETLSSNLSGIFIRPFYRRNYRFKEIFAHLIGYTSLSNNLSKTSNVPNWQVGKAGIEVTMDSFLKGEIGYSKYEINVYGHVIRQLEQTPSKAGHNISLTINAELQNFIYTLLSQYNSASAVVVEVETGNILSLASYPSFDPNLFAEGIPTKVWKDLTSNNKAPLSNKPLLGVYPPGSTIKPIMILEALERKYITRETKFKCEGFLDVGPDRFHCWKRNGHGEMNMEQALAESCDVYFYKIAMEMNEREMSEAGLNFGFSKKHLPWVQAEATGRVLVDKKSSTKYQTGDRIISIIGQGKWQTTPLQLANMTNIIANEGKKVPLNLLKSIEYEDKIIYPKNTNSDNHVPYNKTNLKLIKKTFYDSINAVRGTGILGRTGDKDWALAGKTGTSQVRRITMEERATGVISNHLLDWEKRDHALFVGFVPYHKPAYSISVVIDHGGGASITTVPLAKEIALFLRDKHSQYEAEKKRLENLLAKKVN